MARRAHHHRKKGEAKQRKHALHTGNVHHHKGKPKSPAAPAAPSKTAHP